MTKIITYKITLLKPIRLMGISGIGKPTNVFYDTCNNMLSCIKAVTEMMMSPNPDYTDNRILSCEETD